MVALHEIRTSNDLINDLTAPRVAVFAGATSGVGYLTLRALVASGASMRIHVIGRESRREAMTALIQELQTTNPKAQIIWKECEISLLAEVRRICKEITKNEACVDLLFLSAGFAPLGVRRETTEGLEVTRSLEVYSRILFIQHLLPLMKNAESPRVVSVLGGGTERPSLELRDLDLKKPGNFNVVKARLQNITLHTTILEKLATKNPFVTFIHSWPGLVNTGNVRKSTDGRPILAWFVWLIAEPIIRLLSFNDNEAAQRNLFQSTSAAFGGSGTSWSGRPAVNTMGTHGNGLFLINNKCDATPNEKTMLWLRENALETVWEHTQEVLGPYF